MNVIFLQKNKSYKKGFTLVETLVALSIFSLSVLALMVALGGGLKSANFAKSKITASYLAQEGIELIRNMRDTFVLYDGGADGWPLFLAHVNDCQNTKGCIFHTEDLVYGEENRPITQIEIDPCINSFCPKMYFHPDTGAYDYDPTPPETIISDFRRHMSVEIVNGHEAKINSWVYWGEENNYVLFNQSIFDWN
jgi:prepilin-type N-terminal cleavage/methylation domain-containing protein